MAPEAPARSGHVVIGVDTHKHIHVAAVIDPVGGILDSLTIPTDHGGYQRLLDWAASFGRIIAFGIEGTGSYGSALASFLRRNGHEVVEVSRPDRRLRRLNGKSDTLDAENAARSVLAGFATAVPKTADGAVEMIRQLKVVHDTAVKDRSSTMITLKAMLVHSSDDLREQMAGKSRKMLARHLAALRPRGIDTVDDANRHALRSLARRWQALHAEAADLEQMIKDLVRAVAPDLLDRFGVGADTAAEILIVAGDNPERIRSEAAFAKLAGISPVPTGSGMTSGRHRINHGGHRQLNAAIYRTVIVRMRFHEPTIRYVERRTAEGKSKRDIIRCLKRYVIREVYHLVKANPATGEIAS
ncbi:IS110 family transposase [Curtobacterium sp. MCBD17_040]|uniref:IS110 family transposase n=1 Tax=Curtobacterium sp. MCBD17_040 TaxID=2175674 RepID=UPI000DAACAD2|nr:IS110 family transposase [Curtobacterium sp. MCBD17_040]WIB64029.1 IS110 family transposase [Curtobacterium sp. MCBD17_040]